MERTRSSQGRFFPASFTRVFATLILLAAAHFPALARIDYVGATPQDPRSNESVSVGVSGGWGDGCWHLLGIDFVAGGGSFHFRVRATDVWRPGMSCALVSVYYSTIEVVGELPAGTYDVTVEEVVSSVRETGGTAVASFTVRDAECDWPHGIECAEGEFCRLTELDSCRLHEVGVCTDLPSDCPPDDDPVCGCDLVTYPNPCLAYAAGMSVRWLGACPDPCGGFAGLGCDDPDETCVYSFDGCCCDLPGYCRPVPEDCPDICAPVCGCNGRTFASRCHATRAGSNVAHEGTCDQDPIRNVVFSPGGLMEWTPDTASNGYNVYLKVMDGPVDDLGQCHLSDIEPSSAIIDGVPAPGTVWLLQVTGRYKHGEGTMGLGEGCAPREPAEPCVF